MAYAEAAGLPAIYGLYATIVPLLVYAVFGPSRILVLGPDSSLGSDDRGGDPATGRRGPARAVTVAAVLAILAGVVRSGRRAAAPRVRHRSSCQADSLRIHERDRSDGARQSAAQAVRLLGQGRRVDRARRRDLSSGIVSGRANWAPVALGGGTLLIIMLLKRFMRVPGVLLAVGGATLAVAWLDLSTPLTASACWASAAGLPAFAFPVLGLNGHRRPVDGRPSRSPWSRSPTPACCHACTPPRTGPMSIPIRR